MSNEPQEVSLNKEDIEKIREKIGLIKHKVSVAFAQYRQIVYSQESSDCPDDEGTPKVTDEQLRATLFQELDTFEQAVDFENQSFKNTREFVKKYQ